MAIALGREFLVEITFDNENWVTLPGQRSTSHNISTETVDTTVKTASQWRALSNCGIRSDTISAQCIVNDLTSKDTLNQFYQRMFADPVIRARLRNTFNSAFNEKFYLITNIERSGEYNGAEEYTVTFEGTAFTDGNFIPPEGPTGRPETNDPDSPTIPGFIDVGWGDFIDDPLGDSGGPGVSFIEVEHPVDTPYSVDTSWSFGTSIYKTDTVVNRWPAFEEFCTTYDGNGDVIPGQSVPDFAPQTGAGEAIGYTQMFGSFGGLQISFNFDRATTWTGNSPRMYSVRGTTPGAPEQRYADPYVRNWGSKVGTNSDYLTSLITPIPDGNQPTIQWPWGNNETVTPVMSAYPIARNCYFYINPLGYRKLIIMLA